MLFVNNLLIMQVVIQPLFSYFQLVIYRIFIILIIIKL